MSTVTRFSLNRICPLSSLWCGHTRADLVMVTAQCQSQFSGSVTVRLGVDTCTFCLIVWWPVRPCWPLRVSRVRGARLCSEDTLGQCRCDDRDKTFLTSSLTTTNYRLLSQEEVTFGVSPFLGPHIHSQTVDLFMSCLVTRSLNEEFCPCVVRDVHCYVTTSVQPVCCSGNMCLSYCKAALYRGQHDPCSVGLKPLYYCCFCWVDTCIHNVLS